MHLMNGEFGFWPLSPEVGLPVLRNHWETVEKGAARSGRTPDRREWRVIRDVFVAETDDEARRLSIDGFMGETWRRYSLGLYRQHNLLGFLKHDPGIPDSDVTLDYCAEHLWLMGSPETVASKLRRLFDEVGGFGVVLMQWYDYADTPGPWQESMRRFAEEVMPRVRDLVPTPPAR